MRKIAACTLVCAAFAASPSAMAEESLSATPYRPTLSNPAELSAPGWVEIETGLMRSRSQDEKRQSLPYTVKLALDEDWGIMLGGDAYLRSSAQGEHQSGIGDTNFTLKHRFALPDNPDLAFGMELGVKTPTAKKNLGSGKADWTVNGIMSLDLDSSWRLDTNLGMTRLGSHAPDEGRSASFLSTALSKGIGDWTVALEWAGTRQRGTANERQWLAAASYAVTPRFVIDFGGARARQGTTRDNSVFVGLTWLAGRVF